MPEGNATPDRHYRQADEGHRPEEIAAEIVKRQPPPPIQQAAATGAAMGAGLKKAMEEGSFGITSPLAKLVLNMSAMALVAVGAVTFYRDNRADQMEDRKFREVQSSQMVGAIQQNSQQIERNTRSIEKLVDRLDRKIPMP